MSRLALLLSLMLTLWLGLAGCASSPFSAAPVIDATTAPPPSPSTTTPQPPEPAPEPPPAPEETPSAAEVVVTPLEAPAPDVPVNAHIALLLPTKSRDFSRAAEAVRTGFSSAAALATNKTLPVKVYALDNENEALLAAYAEAMATGARCIVAGLTRNGAATIATSNAVSVPTLVLNQIERGQVADASLYSFSLSLDDEARQVAHLLASQGKRKVAVISGPSPLSKRIRDAFENEWLKAGGEMAARLDVGLDPAQYPRLRPAVANADSIFIAAESALARQVRPYVAGGVATYATSQVFDGRSGPGANVDLQDVHFVDMPWMVEPAHSAVAIYPRSAQPLSADLDRLYALGIDAYRLAHLLATNAMPNFKSLDGVTGKITLADGYHFQRELTPAYFDAGVPLPSAPTDR